MQDVTFADGVTIEGTDEWKWIPTGCTGARLQSLGNVVIDVSVHGNAAAAGLSFGDYKDLLAPVKGECFIRLDIDWHARRWVFQADARIGARNWWNGGIGSTDDLLHAPLLFKAHHPRGVVFRNLCVRPLERSCALSVVITCYRFSQRLRHSLRGWCQQVLPSGALEIVVVNPESPDDTHHVVFAAAREYPHVRLRELALPAAWFRNKGRLINHGIAASSGEWIWLTDADCLFPPDAAATALGRVRSQSTLFYGERRHLTEAATRALLAQRHTAPIDFEALLRETRSDANLVPWGYCQLFHRSIFDRVRYRENVESFSHSDNVFVEDCAASGVWATQLDGLRCLHLVHPWAWQGTNDFL